MTTLNNTKATVTENRGVYRIEFIGTEGNKDQTQITGTTGVTGKTLFDGFNGNKDIFKYSDQFKKLKEKSTLKFSDNAIYNVYSKSGSSVSVDGKFSLGGFYNNKELTKELFEQIKILKIVRKQVK